MAVKSRTGMLTVNLADETRLRAMRTVLGYEAVVRGLSVSQTLIDMVFEAVDLETYPEAVREELEAIAMRREARAAQRAAEASGLARSA